MNLEQRNAELIVAISRARFAVQCGCPLANLYVKEANALGRRTLREIQAMRNTPLKEARNG